MTNQVVNQPVGETTNEQTVKEGESRRKKGERRKCKKVSHIHTYSLFSLSFTHTYPRVMHARVCVCAWQGVKEVKEGQPIGTPPRIWAGWAIGNSRHCDHSLFCLSEAVNCVTRRNAGYANRT